MEKISTLVGKNVDSVVEFFSNMPVFATFTLSRQA